MGRKSSGDTGSIPAPAFQLTSWDARSKIQFIWDFFTAKYGMNCVFSVRLTNKSPSHNHYFHRWALLIYFGILKHTLEFTLATAIQLNTELGKSIPLLICPDFSSIPFLYHCLTEKNGKGPKSLKFGAITGLLSCFSDAGTQTRGCIKNPSRSMYKTYQSHLLEGCHRRYQCISSAIWGE